MAQKLGIYSICKYVYFVYLSRKRIIIAQGFIEMIRKFLARGIVTMIKFNSAKFTLFFIFKDFTKNEINYETKIEQ